MNKISNIIPVSVEEKLENGISVLGNKLYDGDKVFELGELKKLSGKHNGQNIAVSYAAAKAAGVSLEEIISKIKSFEGLAHRMQYVAEKNGVRFINDSKATNAEAASKALVTFDDIYWIIGGVPKEGGIESLSEFFSRIRKAYIIGQATEEFAKTLDGKVQFEKCGDLEKAFTSAAKDALTNGRGVVLLSPACASFDQWPNFEVRGEAFCKMVSSL